MYQYKAKILNNIRISGHYFKLSFNIPHTIAPGQFIEIKVGDSNEPLLRRPLSVHSLKQNGKKRIAEILYEIVGKGTEALSKKRFGEILDIIGPLGNGFKYQSPVTSRQSPVLVAGGIGVAPLVALAQKLKTQNSKFKPVILLGAKTKGQLLCEEELKTLGCDVKISTDDGSRGYKGFVTDLLKDIPETGDRRPATIYACGPKPMLKEVARIANSKRIPCQVLLEEYMACGVGVCLGCPVMTKSGYKMVCKEGPVFEAGDIIWE